MAAGANPPNLADWLQGVGTVAAFVLTGAALVWEARARRRDRVEQDRAFARGVVIISQADDLITDDVSGEVLGARGVSVRVDNYCTEPAIDVRVFLDEPKDASEYLHNDTSLVIGPGKSHGTGWRLPEPVSGNLAQLATTLPRGFVEYQVGGRRWVRHGSQQPVLASDHFD